MAIGEIALKYIDCRCAVCEKGLAHWCKLTNHSHFRQSLKSMNGQSPILIQDQKYLFLPTELSWLDIIYSDAKQEGQESIALLPLGKKSNHINHIMQNSLTT